MSLELVDITRIQKRTISTRRGFTRTAPEAMRLLLRHASLKFELDQLDEVGEDAFVRRLAILQEAGRGNGWETRRETYCEAEGCMDSSRFAKETSVFNTL